MPASPTVASLSIDAISPEGEAFVISLAVGTPYPCGAGEWACPVALGGLHDRLADMHGVDAFQALCLAIRLSQTLLQAFRDKGGRLLVGGDDFPLEAYGFGRPI